MTDDNLSTLPGWDALSAAGEVPPAGQETLTRAQAAVQRAATDEAQQSAPARRRRTLVPVLAVAAVAAVVATGALLFGTSRHEQPVAGLPSSTPTATTGPRYLQNGSTGCLVGYSPERLRERTFAFDGTVLAVTKSTPKPGTFPMPLPVATFKVNEWFKPDGGAQTRIVMTGAWEGRPTYAYGLPFKVGDRLLVTGDLYVGGPDSEVVGRAWNCQFSRFYDEASAREWRETFGK